MPPTIALFISGNLAATTMLAVYDVLVIRGDLQVVAFTDGCLLCDDSLPCGVQTLQLADMEALISRADFFLTSIRSPGSVERHLLRFAHAASIPSILLLADLGSGAKKFYDDKGFIFPDLLLVADRFTHQHLLKAGIPESIVSPAGSPYLDRALQRIQPHSVSGSETDIGFYALPNDSDFLTFPVPGAYTEFSVLQLIHEVANTRQNETIWVRPHPKQRQDFQLGKFGSAFVQPHQLLDAENFTLFSNRCSAFISTYSTALLVAALADKPCVSLQPTNHPIRAELYGALGIPIAHNAVDLHAFIDDRPKPSAQRFIDNHLYHPGKSLAHIQNTILEFVSA